MVGREGGGGDSGVNTSEFHSTHTSGCSSAAVHTVQYLQQRRDAGQHVDVAAAQQGEGRVGAALQPLLNELHLRPCIFEAAEAAWAGDGASKQRSIDSFQACLSNRPLQHTHAPVGASANFRCAGVRMPPPPK